VVRRAGSDVTIVATGWMVHRALAAAEKLAQEGINAEVIDPRTVAPLDLETIFKSVEKTRHVVLVDQGTRHASVSAIIASEIVEQRFSSLAAPIAQVTARDSTIPYSEPLEAYMIPDVERITSAVRAVLKR
jgi:acetoin:2,6-dichlorophenolindophenol oxidoreductase subunit beta